MAKDKKTTSSSRLKKLKLSKDVRNSSNLRWSSSRLAHQFNFSNTVDDPIKIEEVEDPSEDSKQGSVYGEEASSKDNSQDTSIAPGETEMVEGSLDERTTTIRECQYKHTSWLTLSPVSFSPSSFSCIFLFPCLMLSILQVSPRSTFQIDVDKDFSLDLSLLY